MRIIKSQNKQESGQKAAAQGAQLIKETIAAKGTANIILATGASQFEMIEALTATEGIDWSAVTMFHLDEYIGLDDQHPASFRKYLRERFEAKVAPLRNAYYVEAESGTPGEVCQTLNEQIQAHPIDVCFAGIGENGHLAFNDPPADFDTEEPYIVVDLDEACRKQQMGEGWFATIDDVPRQAISMGIRQICKSQAIILTVPDDRKAEAVKNTLEGEVSNIVPASILQQHDDTAVYLDPDSASLLSED
jgi:glucosamine-6-phosphate deaminase